MNNASNGQRGKTGRGRKKVTVSGGEFIHCDCGTWFIPIFKNQTTCIKCRKEARTRECHQYAPELWGMV